jgi:hypothetical protein
MVDQINFHDEDHMKKIERKPMMIHQKNFDGEDVMKKIKRKPIKIQFIL